MRGPRALPRRCSKLQFIKKLHKTEMHIVKNTYRQIPADFLVAKENKAVIIVSVKVSIEERAFYV